MRNLWNDAETPNIDELDLQGSGFLVAGFSRYNPSIGKVIPCFLGATLWTKANCWKESR